MKTASHQYEDKLLEFAYGELPPHEAQAVDAHVRSCQRCAQALTDLRGVRSTMDQLPLEAAPDAGLASLLAFAEQQAARNRAIVPLPWWRRLARARLLAVLSSATALAVVGVVAWEANRAYAPSPAAVALEAKAKREAPAAPAPAPALAQRADDAAPASKEAPRVDDDQLAPSPASRSPAPSLAESSLKRGKAKGSAPSGPEEKADVLFSSKAEEAKARAQDKELSPGARGGSSNTVRDEAASARGSLSRQEGIATEVPQSEKVAVREPALPPAPAEVASAPASKSLGLSGFEPKVAKKVQRWSADTKTVADSEAQVVPSPSLVESARAARLKGDLGGEVKFALAALASGVSGADRLEMLNRLCSAYEQLGEAAQADAYCDRVLMEFPSSAPASAIALRRRAVQSMPAKASSSGTPAEPPARESAKPRPSERNQ